MASSADELTDEQLLALHHNNHVGAFRGYLRQSRHSSDKQSFLRSWVKPAATDRILECGSSSGKTSIDFARHSKCLCLGVDFDPAAVAAATTHLNTHFPEIGERCRFVQGDLANMKFDIAFNKIVMPDFSEHIPDRIFSAILLNLKTQLGDARLYVYTPNRSHVFEVMKHRNFILKNTSGHINVKSRRQLEKFLQNNGWRVETSTWRRSAIPIFKYVEPILGSIPLIGRLFQRRIVLTARPL